MNRSEVTRWLALLFLTFLTTIAYGIDSNIQRNVYYPKPSKNLTEAKTTIARVLNDKCVAIYDSSNSKIKYKSASVFDDRIELSLKAGIIPIYFSKLFGESDIKVNIRYRVYGNNDRDDYYDQVEGLKNILIEKNDSAFFGMKFHSPSQFPVCDKELADALYFIQLQLNTKRYEALLMVFKPLAEKYIALSVKPVMPEEQRRYVVKANLYNQQKEYEKAIEQYKRAIDIDQTAYPEAYNNLALLFAQVHSYNTAIYYMKKYLLLGPGPQDARSGQDKIYEWEESINKE